MILVLQLSCHNFCSSFLSLFLCPGMDLHIHRGCSSFRDICPTLKNFLFFWPWCSLNCFSVIPFHFPSIFCSYSNTFPERHHKIPWWVQLCPAVGPWVLLLPCDSPWPLLWNLPVKISILYNTPWDMMQDVLELWENDLVSGLVSGSEGVTFRLAACPKLK